MTARHSDLVAILTGCTVSERLPTGC